MRRLPFDRRVEALLTDRDDLASIAQPMLSAWRQLREQNGVFDEAVRALTKSNPTCRLLMSMPGIGVVSVLAFVSTVEEPASTSRLIQNRSDQNPCAQARRPMDMIFQGWSMIRFQASQH